MVALRGEDGALNMSTLTKTPFNLVTTRGNVVDRELVNDPCLVSLAQ